MKEHLARELRSENYMIKHFKDYRVPAYVYRLIDATGIDRRRIGELTDSGTYNCYAASRKGEVHFTPVEMRELSDLTEQWFESKH